MNKYRSHNCNELRKTDVGKNICLSGWINKKRDHGNLLFIDLRDNYGITQCIIDKENPNFKEIEKIQLETVIRIEGKVVNRSNDTINNEIKTGEVEVGIENFKVVKSSQKDFTFNYEYKVDLGVYYEGLPEKLKVVFDEIGNVEEYPEGRGVKYMTKSRSSYAEVQKDLQLCKDKGIAVSKIVGYKDGVSINIDSILNESD